MHHFGPVQQLFATLQPKRVCFCDLLRLLYHIGINLSIVYVRVNTVYPNCAEFSYPVPDDARQVSRNTSGLYMVWFAPESLERRYVPDINPKKQNHSIIMFTTASPARRLGPTLFLSYAAPLFFPTFLPSSSPDLSHPEREPIISSAGLCSADPRCAPAARRRA